MRTEIQLSPKAINEVNQMLTEGNRVQIDYDNRTGELKIYEVPRMKTKYRVIISGKA